MSTPRGQAAVNRVRELEAELAKKNEIIEKVATKVMEYEGCYPGRVDFLKECGIDPADQAGTRYVWIGAVVKLTDKGMEECRAGNSGEILRYVEGLLDAAEDDDCVEGGCSYVHEGHYVAEEDVTRRSFSLGIKGDKVNPPRLYQAGDWA